MHNHTDISLDNYQLLKNLINLHIGTVKDLQGMGMKQNSFLTQCN